MADKRKKKYDIKTKYFWSYVIIASIALVLNIGLYVYSAKYVAENISQKHEKLAVKTQNEINNLLNEGISQLQKTSQNEHIEEVLEIRLEDFYYGTDAMLVKELLGDFGDVLEGSNAVDRLLFYDIAQESLLMRDANGENDILHKAKAVDYLFHELELPPEIYYNKQLSLYVCRDVNDVQRVYCIVSVYRHRYNQPDGLVIGELSVNALLDAAALYSDDEIAYYPASEKEGFLGNENEIRMLVEKLQQQEFAADEVYKNKFGKETYMCSKIETIVPELICYSVTNRAVYYSPLQYALVLTAINIIIIMMIILIVANYLSKKSVAPWEHVLNTIGSDKDRVKNLSYDYIEQRVSSTVNRLHQLEYSWKTDFVAKVLYGQETETKSIREFEEKYVKIGKNGYRVLTVRLTDVAEQSDKDILLFCVSNILEELLYSECVTESVKGYEVVHFIVCGDVDMEVFERKVLQGLRFLDSRLTIRVYAGWSAVVENFADTAKAKIEADYAVEFAALSGMHGQIVSYDSISEKKNDVNQEYATDFRKLAKKILANNYSEALSFAEKIWEKYLQDSCTDIQFRRSKLLSIISMVSVSYRENIGDWRLDNTLGMNLVELYEMLIKMLEDLIHYNDTDVDSKHIFDKVCCFIQENYADMNMSAVYICEKCNVAYTSITKIFKQYSGESIIDYLHKVRINNSKKLLESGKTVNGAATLIGYSDTRSFIRAFKKYEGITPGQYKSR